MYKKILIPTDGSAFCERAIAHGMQLAKLAKAGVVGVTVTHSLQMGAPHGIVPESLEKAMQTEIGKAAAANLAGVERAAAAAGVACETVHEAHDHPWEAIVAVAKRTGCDLIVMASHGRRGVAARILGSETQKVLTHTEIPVLVVR
jgi:nucleotide-binding universal stress UspA family protein